MGSGKEQQQPKAPRSCRGPAQSPTCTHRVGRKQSSGAHEVLAVQQGRRPLGQAGGRFACEGKLKWSEGATTRARFLRYCGHGGCRAHCHGAVPDEATGKRGGQQPRETEAVLGGGGGRARATTSRLCYQRGPRPAAQSTATLS